MRRWLEEMRRWLIKYRIYEKMVDKRLKRCEDGWLKLEGMRRWLIKDRWEDGWLTKKKRSKWLIR